MVVKLFLACLLPCCVSELFEAFVDFSFHGLEFIAVEVVVADLSPMFFEFFFGALFSCFVPLWVLFDGFFFVVVVFF